MKYEVPVLALCLFAASSHAAAEESFEFTLDEVDAAESKAKTKRRAGKAAAPPAVDTKRAIEQSLGEVRWGLSKADLVKVLKAQIRAEFEQRIKVERDIMRQDALYQEANEQYRRLSENYVSFDGKKTGWDVSPIGPEFTHGNRETMLVVSRRNTRDMYFFIQGRLWKWYRELSPDQELATLRAHFGAGTPQAERRNDSDTPYEGTTWSDGSTRVTAMRRGGDTCLIFEELRTIEQLAVLRHNVQPNRGKQATSSVIDAVLLSGAELEARNR